MNMVANNQISLSEFRWSFIDAQNKASFERAGRKMISEFRKFMMNENSDEDNEDYITLFVSKRLIIIQWEYDWYTYEVVLSRDRVNTASTTLSKFPPIRHEKITIYDSEIVEKISKFIGDLFTGENFDILPNNLK